jgi:hypothetical protein
MDSNHDQMPEVDLADLESLKKDRFEQLKIQRRWILEDFAQKLQVLEKGRDALLNENIQKMVAIGIPSDDLPLPPENEEGKKALAHGLTRKLDDSQIRRVLKEIMKPDEEYPSSYLIQNLRIAYKDWIDFCKRNVPAFLSVDGKNKWRVYKLVVSK